MIGVGQQQWYHHRVTAQVAKHVKKIRFGQLEESQPDVQIRPQRAHLSDHSARILREPRIAAPVRDGDERRITHDSVRRRAGHYRPAPPPACYRWTDRSARSCPPSGRRRTHPR
ncbi:Uncharacterised protein [Mycobacteroides abscessus subsp. abscessus]|nr:Uncharacterised protein [Mycobacteroides abscessus subsp. abscessus]